VDGPAAVVGVLWLTTFAVWVRWLWHHPQAVSGREHTAGPDLGHVKGMGGTRLDNVVELEHPKRWEADVDLADTELLVDDVAEGHPAHRQAVQGAGRQHRRRLRRGRLEHVARS
jgi:hypothetical protein